MARLDGARAFPTGGPSDPAAGIDTVLVSGSDRLVLSAAFVQRLLDTAQALEGEVQFLTLRAVFEDPRANRRKD